MGMSRDLAFYGSSPWLPHKFFRLVYFQRIATKYFAIFLKIISWVNFQVENPL